MEGDTAQTALAEWVNRLAARGFDGVRERYLGPVVREFFECGGRRYEVTTEAVWDRGTEGDLRVFIEVSEALEPSPRTILATDVIITPDGTVIGGKTH